eukprot:scaffold517_cov392-Prasinococcus_capsulatus_cf.AAC.17
MPGCSQVSRIFPRRCHLSGSCMGSSFSGAAKCLVALVAHCPTELHAYGPTSSTERALRSTATQDVRNVVPQAVRENKDGFLEINYSSLIPLLVEAMKEQQGAIEVLSESLSVEQPSLRRETHARIDQLEQSLRKDDVRSRAQIQQLEEQTATLASKNEVNGLCRLTDCPP